MQAITAKRFDAKIKAYIPHREPMLLINQIGYVEEKASQAYVFIDKEASFYEQDKGVAAWIGLEYMGQTAALMGGYRLEQGLMPPHLGFLLGTRKYEAFVEYFEEGSILEVRCQESHMVGESFATFACEIYYKDQTELLARSTLSVFRKLKEDIK